MDNQNTTQRKYRYTLDEAKTNTKIIKGINILMAVINVLFSLVLFICFLRAETTMQMVVFGGLAIFNLFLAAIHTGGAMFSKYISGEERIIKEKLLNEELSY